MKAIPVAVRERILKLYDQGKSTAEIAARFGHCVAAVRRVRQHFKARGTLAPQTHRCGRKSLLTAARKTRLQQRLARQPDATLAELGTQFKRPTSTIALWLSRLGWSRKQHESGNYEEGNRDALPKTQCGIHTHEFLPFRPIK